MGLGRSRNSLHFVSDRNVDPTLGDFHLHFHGRGVEFGGLLGRDGVVLWLLLLLLLSVGETSAAIGKSYSGSSNGRGSGVSSGGSVAIGERVFSLGTVGGVAFDVLAEVVGAHEAFVAHRTGKPLLASVCPEMTGQLVRTGKPLEAAVPAARVGSLACVRTDVGLQVRALSVGFPAAFPGADVRASLPVFPGRCGRVQRAVRAQRGPRNFLAPFIAVRQPGGRGKGRNAAGRARAVIADERRIETRGVRCGV